MGKKQVGVPSIHGALDDFVTKLKRKQMGSDHGSLALARHTTEVLIHAVAAQQAPTVEGIVEGVRTVSKKLVDARPLGAWRGVAWHRTARPIRPGGARFPTFIHDASASIPLARLASLVVLWSRPAPKPFTGHS